MNFKKIENLFMLQDTNKKLKLVANEEQLQQINEIDNGIMEEFKNIIVGGFLNEAVSNN